jgi:hypothetical protein
MNQIKNLLLEKILITGTGVATFLTLREPITREYTDFFANRIELNNYTDVILAAGHVTAVGILTASAIGIGMSYATKKYFEYTNKKILLSKTN